MASGSLGHLDRPHLAVKVAAVRPAAVVMMARARVGATATAPPRDHGAASVLAIAMIAIVLMLGGTLMFAAAASAVKIAAQHAADEAALAGAREARAQVALGRSAASRACAAARSAASEQGAILSRCVTREAVVTVTVELSRGLAHAHAYAVAGPVYTSSPGGSAYTSPTTGSAHTSSPPRPWLPDGDGP